MDIAALFESESDDYAARLSAIVVHKQVIHWLKAHEGRLSRDLGRVHDPRFPHGYVLRSHQFDMDADYPDLMIMFVPEAEKQVSTGWGSRAGLATTVSSKIIVMRCMLGPNDFKHLASRFATGFRRSFIHEFQHYLMRSRKPDHVKGSNDPASAGDMASYFNDSDETNAYYQEAVHHIPEFFITVLRVARETDNPETAKIVAARIAEFQSMTVGQLVTWAKEQFFDREFLGHASPKTRRALDKRLARHMATVVRPILMKADKQS